MSHCRTHHKICGTQSVSPPTTLLPQRVAKAQQDEGYTLVALLAVMTVLALFALAAAPSIRQQVQREQEQEAIFRGEQVADAIRSFYLASGPQALPNSVDQLLEGVQIQGRTRKLQILRASAARDPLTSSGEWGFVRPQSFRLIDFQRNVITYSGSFLPTPRDLQMAQLQGVMATPLGSILDTGSTGSSSSGSEESVEASGPFVGVTSRSGKNSVLHYYGIQRHNQWVFTPLFKW